MKKICVITSSRADYGLLLGVLKGLKNSNNCELQIIATGMHLSAEFGNTWRIIEKDGFKIDRKVEMLLGSDSSVAITKSIGLGFFGFADVFYDLSPDLIVLLGDRFELLAVASSALIAGIPIAHLHGGELTTGAFDDSIRHAITKMSSLHFTAAEPYRQRVIQMGEDPNNVWCVGGFGLDEVYNLERLPLADLESFLGISLGDQSLLITFHPETATLASSESQMIELFSALKKLDAHLIFTMPNADTGGRVIFQMIEEFVSERPSQRCAHVSLGQNRYLSTLSYVDAVVGNSSSGIIEAPSFKIGTVNIGSRQDGRLRAPSIVDCKAEREDIAKAIALTLSDPFKLQLKNISNPYGGTGASKRTVSLIEAWQPMPFKKKFNDLEFNL
jgi:GDP/UDP-N,N'-diacetylbacillosamine 2-epimerase (hydrolysing)